MREYTAKVPVDVIVKNFGTHEKKRQSCTSFFHSAKDTKKCSKSKHLNDFFFAFLHLLCIILPGVFTRREIALKKQESEICRILKK